MHLNVVSVRAGTHYIAIFSFATEKQKMPKNSANK
jgi:hypothetical protein